MDREQNKTINQDWQKRFNIKAVTAEEAVRKILPGHRVFIGTGAAQPSMLINAMTDRADELVDVEIIQLVTMGDPPYTKKELSGSFKVNSFYISEESIRASIIYAHHAFRHTAAF
jgi:4-hydroxybutyrate CoA-transferase